MCSGVVPSPTPNRCCVVQVLAFVGVCVMVLSTTVILQAEMNREHEVVFVDSRPHPNPPADLPPPQTKKPLPPVLPKPDKPVLPDKSVVPDNPPHERPDETIVLKKPVDVDKQDTLDYQKEPNPTAEKPVRHEKPVDQEHQAKDIPGNKTKGVAGGGGVVGGGGGMAGGGEGVAGGGGGVAGGGEGVAGGGVAGAASEGPKDR